MHQKITSLLAAVLAVLLLCSCGGQPSQQPNLPETPEEAPYAFTLDYHRCAPLVERWRRPGWWWTPFWWARPR